MEIDIEINEIIKTKSFVVPKDTEIYKILYTLSIDYNVDKVK